MTLKKPQNSITAAAWPYTPEPSPRLQPSALPHDPEDKLNMSNEGFTYARPISVAARREGILSPGRPNLEDVLNNTAPPPYSLAAFTAFLSHQHCLETLEFTTEARKYAERYKEVADELDGALPNTETDQGLELEQLWNRMLDIYVKPGAPREINLPSEERDELVEQPYEPNPPPPDSLDAAVKRMYDLMSDSIFIPFCNSLKTVSHAQTYTALSELMDQSNTHEPSRMTYTETSPIHRRIPSRRRRSPPATSATTFEPSRSPPTQYRAPQSSSLSSALSRQSRSRISTHVSGSSMASESALTDTSGGGDSPVPGEQDSVMTPPTTPPTSDIGSNTASSVPLASSSSIARSHRNDNGGWKKMGMKFFGGGNKKETGPRR